MPGPRSPGLRYAVEYDGAEWLSSPDQRAHDRARREAVRHEDFTVDVFKRKNVFGPHRDVEERLMAAAMLANRVGRVHF